MRVQTVQRCSVTIRKQSSICKAMENARPSCGSGLNGGGGYLLRLIMIDFKGGSFDCVFDEVLLLFDIS